MGTSTVEMDQYDNQHIANKHRVKEFTCGNCNRGYAFLWQLDHHKKGCGKIWSCGSCDKTYSERLSLNVHCKRSSHILPDHANFKNKRGAAVRPPKKSVGRPRKVPHDPETSTGTNDPKVIYVVMPIIINNTIPSVHSSERPILPKAGCDVTPVDASTQTLVDQQISCSTCDNNKSSHGTSKQRHHKPSSSTQTERGSSSNMRGRMKSASAQVIRSIRRYKKKPENQVKESIETQTLESILRLDQMPLVTSTRTTSTSICLAPDDTLGTVGHLQKQSGNPLISRDASTSGVTEASITESSVQTDDVVHHNPPVIMNQSTTETQTCGTGCDEEDLESIIKTSLDEDFFPELDMYDIETQTNWNTDETTQTDFHNSSELLEECLRNLGVISYVHH